jgi:hypothetical protein
MYTRRDTSRIREAVRKLIASRSPLADRYPILECWAVALRNMQGLSERNNAGLTQDVINASNRAHLSVLIKAATVNVALVELCNLLIDRDQQLSETVIFSHIDRIYSVIKMKGPFPRRTIILKVHHVGTYPVVWQSLLNAALMFETLRSTLCTVATRAAVYEVINSSVASEFRALPSAEPVVSAQYKLMDTAEDIAEREDVASAAEVSAYDDGESLRLAEMDYAQGGHIAQVDEVDLTSTQFAGIVL